MFKIIQFVFTCLCCLDVYSSNKNIFEYESIPMNISDNSLTESLSFNIEINKTIYHIILKPNRHFINLQQILFKSASSLANKNKSAYSRDCFYHGRIKDVKNSSVAVSICQGMQGFFLLDNQFYFIEPIRVRSNTKKRRSIQTLLRETHKIYTTNQKLFETNFEKILEKQKLQKRSVIKDLYIETLVVLDLSFQNHIESINENIEFYVLTLFNMISKIFQHPSIGVSLNIVLDSILKLEDEPFKISQNKEQTLDNFCEFQTKITSKLTNTRMHDVAVLITQIPFKNETNPNKMTLGLAKLGGMCREESSCNINYHHGISVAVTIAHEIGHNLNSDHDPDNLLEMNGLMKSQDDFVSNSYVWSEYSRNSIINFIDEGHANCLENKPKGLELGSIENLIKHLGVINSFEKQCKFEFGANATGCLEVQLHEGQCDRLYCKINKNSSECLSNYPVAEETECAIFDGEITITSGKCKNGVCVSKEYDEEIVNGGWSEWTDWSRCSHECSGGVQFIERFCNKPIPKNGGKFCLGERKKFRTCNLEKCSKREDYFKIHSEMCSKLNNMSNFEILASENEEYIPVFLPEEPCKLFCGPESNTSVYIDTLIKLPDGTKCSSSSEDVCIYGICNKVGCDGKLYSNLSYDNCLVCDGDNSTCSLVEKEIIIDSETEELSIVFEIPIGSMNVKIFNNNILNLFQIIPVDQNDHDFKIYDFNHYNFDEFEVYSIIGPTEFKLGLQLIEFKSDTKLNIKYYVKTKEQTNTKNGSFIKSNEKIRNKTRPSKDQTNDMFILIDLCITQIRNILSNLLSFITQLFNNF